MSGIPASTSSLSAPPKQSASTLSRASPRQSLPSFTLDSSAKGSCQPLQKASRVINEQPATTAALECSTLRAALPRQATLKSASKATLLQRRRPHPESNGKTAKPRIRPTSASISSPLTNIPPRLPSSRQRRSSLLVDVAKNTGSRQFSPVCEGRASSSSSQRTMSASMPSDHPSNDEAVPPETSFASAKTMSEQRNVYHRNGHNRTLTFHIGFQGLKPVDKSVESRKTIKSISSAGSQASSASSSGFSSGSRSDSTPSLCESEPADMSKKALRRPHQTNLSSCAGGPARRLGIPPPKTRPTSACIETITTVVASSFGTHGNLSIGSCNNKGTILSTPNSSSTLSSSGIPGSTRVQENGTEQGPRNHHEQSPRSPSINPLNNLEQGRRQKSIEYLSEADTMNSSNCNIARVSPIRRQMGESESLALNREKKGAEGNNTNCKTSLYETYDTRPPSSSAHHQEQQQQQRTRRTGARRVHPRPQHLSTEPPRQFVQSDSKHGQRAATVAVVEEHENRLGSDGAPQATADCMSPVSEATLSGCKRDETSLFSVKVKVQQSLQCSRPTTPSGSASASTPNLHGNQNSNCTSGKGEAIHLALERPNINFAHLNSSNQRRVLNQCTADSANSSAPHLAYRMSPECQRKKAIYENRLSVYKKPQPAANYLNMLPYRAMDQQDLYSIRSLVTPPPGSPSRSTNHYRRLSESSDLRGSSSSLTGPSNFSANDERHATEIKKLKSDLFMSNGKAASLMTQLVANSQMVSAFEPSLASITTRLQQMSQSVECKDFEINRLRGTIDDLCKECRVVNYLRPRVTSDTNGPNLEPSDQDNGKCRQTSSPKQSPMHSIKGSIVRAFRNGLLKSHRLQETSFSDDDTLRSRSTAGSLCHLAPLSVSSSSSLRFPFDEKATEAARLRDQMVDRDRALTDIRLESLATAHRMKGMIEDIQRLRLEIESLRQENKRLQLHIYKRSAGHCN